MPDPGGTMYAIGVVGTSYVKIGKTTVPVERRLQALQIGQPLPLQILATVPVEANLHRIEKQVHAFLEAEWRRGEWFDLPMDLATLEALIVRAVAYLAAQEDQAPVSDRAAKTQAMGERVRRVRRAQDVTQERLAELSGLNVITISRLEKGTAKEVYADTVAALARALGVSADYLLGLSDKEDGHA